jgi:hypothetical protein
MMITPSDSASAPAEYNAVPEQDMNIQAPQDDLSGAFNASIAVAGSGVLYPQGPRQAQTEALLTSPRGFGAYNIDAGSAPGYDADVAPSG